MKKLCLFIILFWLCNACEKPSDCLESTGTIVTKDVSVLPFNKIKVYRGIEVVITDGPETKVQIEAGANFIDNVQVTQNGDQLIFKDEASCNWVRSYGRVRILVTTPTLEEVYSKTDRDISSNGVLTFPVLRLKAFDKDGDGETGAPTGDFHIQVNNSQLVIENNNVSRYYISGQTQNAILSLYFGDGRIEAQNLTAQTMNIFHRGSNDMIVNPVQSIEGKLVSTGNLILKNIPAIVNVEELYHGIIIYP